MVITGASSGIGLGTARLAARKGAKVVLSSRNGEDLERVCDEIRSQGGQAVCCIADVADPDAVLKLAKFAILEFGRIDTWVNNAGVTVYGKLSETHLEAKRRVFDVNFWGVVHGCRAALPYLRESGGTLINIGSAVSRRAIPIQGIYSASKHALRAYTDALRMELEEEGAPVAVTLIMPGAIDTPYVEHALNLRPGRPVNPPPVYATEVVARAIVRAATRPQRDVYVGGAAKFFDALEKLVPRLADKLMERTLVEGQSEDKPKFSLSQQGLFDAPAREGRVKGYYRGPVFRHSAYTFLSQRPGILSVLLGGAAAGLLAAMSSRAASARAVEESPWRERLGRRAA